MILKAFEDLALSLYTSLWAQLLQHSERPLVLPQHKYTS